MDSLIQQIHIRVNEKIYIKDPNSSELGNKIIEESIKLIDKVGMEHFTFRKLSHKINSTEASIYRYFENKHKLLLYLTSWYWGWMEYQLVFSTTNISSPIERLKLAIQLLSKNISKNEKFGTIPLDLLSRILIAESAKAYLIKEVDNVNKDGAYSSYKRLIARISNIILEINPKFKFSHTLISTIVEGIHHQKYFADHLPSLTDIKADDKQLASFYTKMALATIK